MLELAMLLFTISAVVPAFGPIAADYAGTALSLSEVCFLAFLVIGVIGAAYHRPIEDRILHPAHA